MRSARRPFSLSMTLVLLLAGVGTMVQAAVVDIPASKDNTLYESNSPLSNGAGDYFFAGITQSRKIRRGVIAFDVTGNIPGGATINSVTLTLYMSRSTAADETVSVHRLLADWGEGTSHATGEEGGGASPSMGDATWDHTFYDTGFWTVAGGDYVVTASASQTVGLALGFYSWSSAQMATDVQGWLDSPSTNYGWILIGREIDRRSAKRFDSRTNTNVSQRPVLTVDYTATGPSGACCQGEICTVETPADCTALTGVYQGDDTSCSPNPCITAIGACCLNDATCQVMTESGCTGIGGTYQGDDSVCTPGLCPMGPLPAPRVPPENPITESKRVLGKILYWEEQLSTDNTMACATCHQPFASTADPRHGAVNPGLDGLFGTDDDVFGSFGVVHMDENGFPVFDPLYGWDRQVTGRIAPPVFSALWSHRAFFDGRAGPDFVDPQTGLTLIPDDAALEAQAIGPPMSIIEMGKENRTWDEVVTKLEAAEPLALATYLPPDLASVLTGSPSYPDLFATAFGTTEISAARVAFAIATYQRTLVPSHTPMDLGTLTPQQQQGMNVFLDPANQCTTCHPGPLLTDNSFHNIGVRPIEEDIGRQGVTGEPNDAGRFKTPGLRNVGLRSTFMHNGRHATLEEVIDFYNDPAQQFPDNLDPAMVGINISPSDVVDLVEFLRNGLTDPRVEAETFPFDRPILASERGDADRDGDVDADDYVAFAGCFTGVDAGPVAPGCERLDMDGDGDVDGDDWDLFVAAWTEPGSPYSIPPPVPDGAGGTAPIEVEALTPDGSQLSITWDDQCAPASANLLYGFLDQVSSYAVAGAVCDIADPEVWITVPPGNLWFLVVGTDGIGVESSWGHGTGGERNGLESSGLCGIFVKDVTGSCP